MSDSNKKEITSPEALLIKYVKLNRVCAYTNMKSDPCDGFVDVIRVTTTSVGEVSVSTMCTKHSVGEKEHAIAEGFELAGDTGVNGMVSDAILINPKIVDNLDKTMTEINRLISETSDQRKPHD